MDTNSADLIQDPEFSSQKRAQNEHIQSASINHINLHPMKTKFEQTPEKYQQVQTRSTEKQIGIEEGAFCTLTMPIESPGKDSVLRASSPDARQTVQSYLPQSKNIYAAGTDPKSHHPVKYDDNRGGVNERVFQNQINPPQSWLLQALNTNEEGTHGRFSDQSRKLIKALHLDMKLPTFDMIKAIRDDVITPAKSLSDLKNEQLKSRRQTSA